MKAEVGMQNAELDWLEREIRALARLPRPLTPRQRRRALELKARLIFEEREAERLEDAQ